MISRIPALELMQNLYGMYADRGGEATLRIWRCGYGAAVDLTSKGRSILCGVAGASHQEIEYFVQVGLPDVVRAIGSKISDTELRLVSDEPPIELRFTRKFAAIDVTILLDGKVKGAYILDAT